MTLRRDLVLREIATTKEWDVLVIGGGATGLGTALEAASRGYRTLIVEKYDFAKGTSSRSSKLAHGGVRYLKQLKLALVLDALRERGYMRKNAPHLVHRLAFVVPAYSYSSLPYYGFGLKTYERLAGKLSFGKSIILSKEETVTRLPTIAQQHLKGGVLYFDGQFDDARYAIALMRTLEDTHGCAINYMEAIGLLHRAGRTLGVRVRDRESGVETEILAKSVINATGVFVEEILQMDKLPEERLLAISQGTHFVLPRSYLPGDHALLIPKTADGRVLFAIPWHEHVVIGTTDDLVPETTAEPRSMERERNFLAAHIRRFLGKEINSDDVSSMWSGLRPLIRNGNRNSSKLSRDHKIFVSATGLITVTGGKWTTYRRMGQDAVDQAARTAGLAAAPSRTASLPLHGWAAEETLASFGESEWAYGSDLPALQSLSNQDATLNTLLHPRLPYRKGEVVWAARHEMARTVEDVLARRTRALFLDAHAAMDSAPEAARLLAAELGRGNEWVEQEIQTFRNLAAGYIYQG